MKKSVLRAEGKIYSLVAEEEKKVEKVFNEVIEEIKEEAKPKGRKKKGV